MSQVVPIDAVRAQEDDWFRRLVVGIEAPTLSAQAIRLPEVLEKLDKAHYDVDEITRTLSRLENLESVQTLYRAANSAQATAVEFLDTSLATVASLSQAVDDTVAEVDALQLHAATAADNLNAARAALLEARDASPDPGYQAALTAADDAILQADAARVELHNALAREGGPISDSQQGVAISSEDIRVAAQAAGARKQLDEPLLDVVRRARSGVLTGIDARTSAAAAGSTVGASVAEIAARLDDFWISLTEALVKAREARARGVEVGAPVADVDAAIATLTDLEAVASEHGQVLETLAGAATTATKTTGAESDGEAALSDLSVWQTIAATSVATMSTVIPDPETVLQEAVATVNTLVEQLIGLDADLDATLLLLEEARRTAAALISNPPPIPQDDLDLYIAALRSLEAMIYGASDSVTDIQLIHDEIAPGTVELRGDLIVILNATVESSYAGLPDDWRPTLDAINVKLLEAYALADTGRVTLFQTGDGVDNAIEAADNAEAQQEQAAAEQASQSSGGAVDATGCDEEVHDGVHIYTGDGEPNECTGTAGPDIFHMRGNNDTAFGRGNHDQIHLSWGYDTGYGEGGPDQAWGGTENDQLLGQYGDDFLRDSQDTALDGDRLWGGPGSDDGDILDGDTADSYRMGEGNDKDPKYDEIWLCNVDGCGSSSDEIDKGD